MRPFALTGFNIFMKIGSLSLLVTTWIIFFIPVFSQTVPARVVLGNLATLENWSGLRKSDQEGIALLQGSTEAVFRQPDGAKGSYKHGFRTENDSTANWSSYYGVRFDLELVDDEPVELKASLRTLTEQIPAIVQIQGRGWHTVTLPWSSFEDEQARSSFLSYIKEFALTPSGKKNASFRLKNVCVIQAPVVALRCEVQGKSVPAGKMVEYNVQVNNCTGEVQAIAFHCVRRGWEAASVAVVPQKIILKPGERGQCTVQVTLPNRVPPGGHEIQTLEAVGNGDAANASKLEFITACELPHPYILHTSARWQEIQEKVKNYSWAKDALAEYLKTADAWVVPEVAKAPDNDPNDTMGPYLFKTSNENDLMACGIAWQMKGNKKYAEKVALFLKRLSDPKDGYPITLRGCNQGFVQEGHFFQHIAMAYDMIWNADVLTDTDRKQIEATFRIFIASVKHSADSGSINNWNLSEDCGALYCALAMQDMSLVKRFYSGPSGILDQLAKGTMDDGWWYECSISYNVWCATEFSQVALALQPWGINLKDKWVSASYSTDALLSAVGGKVELNGGLTSTDSYSLKRPFGMSKEVWGPVNRPYREIRDLWNGLLPFLDYRGIMFGVNDSTENKVSGQPFEVAYYLYRDPAYASVIKRGGGKRDLLYGVPELPEQTPEPFRQSAFSDNVGVAMLRSQTENRHIREQIQAVLHYGTHGWAHGHYDRTNLLSLMRYGRSFYNPEMIWYSYEPFMYKFYVQTSLAHNMVVVDEKMQEAAESLRLLFHSGKMMQATAVETNSRWSNPPYGGMVYDYVPVKTFAEKCWREGRDVPIPENPPAYGMLTDFTEPILQRRLMIVTDDYVVLADYLKAPKKHIFESLLQMKGFQGLEGANKKFLRHDAQWNPDPVGSAQFVTDCDWYSIDAPAKSRFEIKWGPGADNEGTRAFYSEDGSLKTDVYSLWPQSQKIMIAAAPEEHGVQKRLFYKVRGDGKTLVDGKFGAWILGQGKIDVSLEGVNQLELETKIELKSKPNLFWAEARIVTSDGKEIPLSQLPVQYENVLKPAGPGIDFFGGPIKIVGQLYKDAVSAQPRDETKPALIRLDLKGLNAVRFKSLIGGDYPLGNEAQRRKTYASQVEGTEAQFLTVIEPYELDSMIYSAVATSPDHLRVELKDGRAQEIEIRNFTGDGNEIEASIQESQGGKILRTETTSANSKKNNQGYRNKP